MAECSLYDKYGNLTIENSNKKLYFEVGLTLLEQTDGKATFDEFFNILDVADTEKPIAQFFYDKAKYVNDGGYDDLELPLKMDQAKAIAFMSGQVLENRYDIIQNAKFGREDVDTIPELTLLKSNLKALVDSKVNETEGTVQQNWKHIQKYYEDHKDENGTVIKGYWNKVLRSLQASFGTSEDLSISDETLYQKAFEQSVLESSRKETAKNELKEALSLVKTDERDDYINEIKYADFNSIYNKLLVELQGSYDMNEMERRLRKLASIFPEFYQIYSKIILPEMETEGYGDIVRMRNLFFSSFKNSYYNSTIVSLYTEEQPIRTTEGGVLFTTQIKSKSFHSNDNTPENNLIKIWKENYNYIQSNVEKLPLLAKVLLNDLQNLFTTSKSYEEIADQLADAMQYAGIDMVRNGKSSLAENLKTDALYEAPGNEIKYLETNYAKDLYYILANIAAKKPVYTSETTEESFAVTQEGAVKNLAKKLRIYDNYVYESVSRNIRGDNVWDINQPSFFTETVELFRADSPEKETALKALLEKYQSTYLFEHSNWLSDFINEDGSINKENTQKLAYYLIGGVKITDGEGLRYKDFAVKDGLIFAITQYFSGKKNQARFVLPTQADSGNNYVLEYKRIEFDPAEEGMEIKFNFFDLGSGNRRNVNLGKIAYDSPLYTAITNSYYSEIARMRNSRDLLFDSDGELRRQYVASDKLTEAEKNDKEFMANRKKAMGKLRQYYHFSKTNAEGEPIILDKDGRVTGNVFKFQYFNSANNIDGFFDTNGTITTNAAIIDEHRDGIIKSRINNQILRPTFEEFYKYGVNGYLTEQNLPSQFHQIMNDQDVSVDYLIADFAINYALFTVEYDNLFSGGTAFTKSADDAVKREGEVTKHHILQNSEDTFTGTYIKDVKVPSTVFDSIRSRVVEYLHKNKPFLTTKEIEKEADEVVAPYKDINSTDSITFITPERYVSILKGLGTDGRTKKVQDAYDRIIKGEYDPEDFNIIMQGLKPFYFGLHFDSDLGIFVPTQVKNAEVPLIPNVIAGTDMEQVLSAMRENKIDSLIFESAGKKGAGAISSITNPDGTISADKLKGMIPQTFYNRFYGIQLETPESHLDYDAVMGLQPKKIILTDLRDEAIYENIPGYEGKLSGPELLQRHNAIEAALVQQSLTDLLRRTGLVSNTGEINTTDVRGLQKILEDELLRSQLSDNFLEAIAVEFQGPGIFDFTVPLYQTPASNKLEQVLLSLFTRNITNQRVKGFGMIQSPGQFFKNTITSKSNLASLPEGVRNKIQLIDRKKEDYKNGTFQLNSSAVQGDKVTKMEVLLPATSKKYFSEDGKVDINALPEELRTFLGYRIPFQGKYSGAIVEVVGWLPEEAGSVIIIPNDILVRMGSDFDIDKLFGMGLSFVKTSDGRFAPYQYSTSPEELEARYDWYVKEAADNARSLDIMVYTFEKEKLQDNLEEWYEKNEAKFQMADDLIRKLQNEIKTLRNDIKKVKHKQKEELRIEIADRQMTIYKTLEFKNRAKILDNIDEEQKEKRELNEAIFDSLVQSGAVLPLEQFAQLPIEKQNIQDAKKNAMVQHFMSVMSNPEHFVESSLPTSYGKIKELADKYGKKASETGLDRQLFTHQNRRAIAARQDKKLVGITASNNAYSLSIFKNIKSSVAPHLSVPVRYTAEEVKKYKIRERFGDQITKEFPNGAVIVELSNIGWSDEGNGQNLSIHGDNISNNYSMVIGAATDGIKDPVLEYINFNTFTSNALGAVVLTGHDWDWAAAFANQPIIKHITDLFFRYKSGYDSLDQNVRDRLEGNDNEIAVKTQVFRDAEETILNHFGINRKSVKAVLGFDPNDVPIEMLSFSISGLDNLINTSVKIKNKEVTDQVTIDRYFKKQYLILKLFQRLDSTGQAITENLLALRADRMGAGPTTSTSNNLIDSIYSADARASVWDGNGTALMHSIYPKFFNDEEKSSYEAIESYLINGNLASLDLFSKFFIKETPAFRSIRNMIFQMARENYNQDIENNLNRHIVTYLNHGFELFATPYEDLFTGDDTLADRILKLRKSNPELFDENRFLAYLEIHNSIPEIEKNKGMKLITLRNTSASINRETENAIIEDWYNMLTRTDNDKIRDLAMDLVKYSFHAFGFQPSLLSFSTLVPIQWLKQIGYTKYISEQVQKLDGAQTAVIDSFIQHNFRNKDLVPTTDYWYYDDELLNEGYSPAQSKRRSRIAPDKATGVLKISPKTPNLDKKLRNPILSPYVVYRMPFNSKQIKELREKGIYVDRLQPQLFRFLGVDADGFQYYRPVTKKGLYGKLYEFGTETILYKEYNDSDDTYILKLQENGVSLQRYVSPKDFTDTVTLKDHSMSFLMPAKDNIWKEDTTTLAAAEEGKRTATTRSYPLGEVGDLITFEGKPQVYTITGLEKLTKENVADLEWINKWSQKEGWTEEHFKKTLGSKTVHVGSWQTSFKKVEDSLPTSEEALKMFGFNNLPLTKVISGGQTGVDLIGLEVAQELGIPTGGTAPHGFITEEGIGLHLRDKYGLKEGPAGRNAGHTYVLRTNMNIEEGDGTVIFGSIDPKKDKGSFNTKEYAEELEKHVLVNPDEGQLRQWIIDNNIKVLNVAGNRGSKLSDKQKAKIKAIIKAAIGPTGQTDLFNQQESKTEKEEDSLLIKVSEVIKTLTPQEQTVLNEEFNAQEPGLTKEQFVVNETVKVNMGVKVSPSWKKVLDKIIKALLGLAIIVNFYVGQSSFVIPNNTQLSPLNQDAVSQIDISSVNEKANDLVKRVIAYNIQVGNDKPYFIVDKSDNTGYIVDAKGSIVERMSLLTGKTKEDVNKPGAYKSYKEIDAANARITPAGKFHAEQVVDDKTGEKSWALHFDTKIEDTAKYKVFVHTTVKESSRQVAEGTPTGADNAVTFGCITMNNEKMQKQFLPVFGEQKNMDVYVLPVNPELRKVYNPSTFDRDYFVQQLNNISYESVQERKENCK